MKDKDFMFDGDGWPPKIEFDGNFLWGLLAGGLLAMAFKQPKGKAKSHPRRKTIGNLHEKVRSRGLQISKGNSHDGGNRNDDRQK